MTFSELWGMVEVRKISGLWKGLTNSLLKLVKNSISFTLRDIKLGNLRG